MLVSLLAKLEEFSLYLEASSYLFLHLVQCPQYATTNVLEKF